MEIEMWEDLFRGAYPARIISAQVLHVTDGMEKKLHNHSTSQQTNEI
jgi:hypothetical protein